MLVRELTTEEFMEMHNLPDLKDLGFQFFRRKPDSDSEYRHETFDGLRLEIDGLGDNAWWLKPVHEINIGLDRFCIGNIIEKSTDNILCPCKNLKGEIASWARNMLKAQNELGETERTLSLPPDLRPIRMIEFDFPGVTIVTLRMFKTIWPPNVNEWSVELVYKAGRQTFTIVKHMNEKEFTPNGVKYWFRMIKKWYKGDNTSRRMAVDLLEKCKNE